MRQEPLGEVAGTCAASSKSLVMVVERLHVCTCSCTQAFCARGFASSLRMERLHTARGTCPFLYRGSSISLNKGAIVVQAKGPVAEDRLGCHTEFEVLFVVCTVYGERTLSKGFIVGRIKSCLMTVDSVQHTAVDERDPYCIAGMCITTVNVTHGVFVCVTNPHSGSFVKLGEGSQLGHQAGQICTFLTVKREFIGRYGSPWAEDSMVYLGG